MEEVAAAQQEADDMRLATEAAVAEALQGGRATRRAESVAEWAAAQRKAAGGHAPLWDHGTIDTAVLEAALVEVNAYPAMSAEGKALAAGWK